MDSSLVLTHVIVCDTMFKCLLGSFTVNRTIRNEHTEPSRASLCVWAFFYCVAVCVFKAWSVFPLGLCCIVHYVGRWFRENGGWIHSWLHRLWSGPDAEQELLERQAYSLRQSVIGLLLNPQTRFQPTHSMWDAIKASHVEKDTSLAFHHVFLNCPKSLKQTVHK